MSFLNSFRKQAQEVTASAGGDAAAADYTGLSEEEIAARDAAEVLDKFDRESAFRNKLPKRLNLLIGTMLVSFSLFQIYTSIFTIQERRLRPVHLMFALSLVYLLYPASRALRRDKIPWYDWLLAAASMVVTLYIPANMDYIIKNVGNYGMTEIFIGIIGILLLMEACRRVVGLPILVIVSGFLAYAFLGQNIIGTFGHRGYTMRQVITHMYFTLEGVYGTPLGVSATFIFLFILFGAFLEKTGVGRLFIDLANAIAGKQIGGPAKVAVISSALQGTVSGSSVANTVSTGSFTIPAMKKLGYKPEFAGAVEAAASTGGQLMPPVMGAAAFLMAESTGFSYGRIVMSAIIPAILYFTGILISVHHEARKLGLSGMKDEDMPRIVPLLKERGHLLMPLAFMIYMLSAKSTPAYAALGAALSSLMAYSVTWWAAIPIAVMIIGKEIVGVHFTVYAAAGIGVWLLICLVRRRLGFTLSDILEVLRNGARNVLAVAIACGMAGMIVGTVTLTGLGLKFATGLASLAGGNIFLLLFFTMLSSIILGMGVPTTANYLITSTICAPALIGMLVALNPAVSGPTLAMIMSAHLFVFYFGIIADITPPVALAAMAGAAIAKGEPFKTGVTATRIAIGAFIVPYIFVFNPAMLMIDAHIGEILLNVCTALLGMYSLSGGLAGFVQAHNKWYESLLLIAGGLGMIIPGIVSDSFGLAVLIFVFVMQKRRARKEVVA